MAAQPTTLEGQLVEAEFLRAAFEYVAPKPNWKMPIDTLLADLDACPYDIAVLVRAIEFMTATQATVCIDRITAPGYYAGPAN